MCNPSCLWRLPVQVFIASLVCVSYGQAASGTSDHLPIDVYLDMPLEQLLSLEVTSVSKHRQKLSKAAAAVFVITQEDIRRSGVTSIPEALRMAPGVQVARENTNKWAVSARGFNGLHAQKLLVLIDGRSIYAPSYSGVYWDVQDTLLEDIARIEVIRGPGATLWGANAANGIINIITKQAAETQGGIVTLGAGSEEKSFGGFRYGAKLGDMGHGRVYLKYFDRDSYTFKATDSDSKDGWDGLQGGFRVDLQITPQDALTLQGDSYQVDANRLFTRVLLPGPVIEPEVDDSMDASGWNLLARWEHTLSNGSSSMLQVYFDHTERDELYLGQTHDAFDVDFNHNFRVGDKHNVIWGLSYRRVEDDFDNTYSVSMNPERRNTDLFGALIQDEVELLPDQLHLTLGSKFEHNYYTGVEIQPSVRLLWTPDGRQSLWGAVSRAVRTPSRVEDSVEIPVLPFPDTIQGEDGLDAEELIAYELGYRIRPVNNLSFDIAAFYNDYDKVRSLEASPTGRVFANKLYGESYGLEVSTDWRPQNWWRLQANYSYLRTTMHLDSDGTDSRFEYITEESSPDHQFSLRSSMDLSHNWELDLWGYYVGHLPASGTAAFRDGIKIDSYVSLNGRLAWRPFPDLEMSLVGQNLLDSRHLEFVEESVTAPTEIERSFYGKVRWEF